MNMQEERTLVLIKPDGVQRGLMGEVITRFEKAGLKVVGMKMVWAEKELAMNHYPDSRTEMLEGIGKKTLETYAKYGMDPMESLGTMEPLELGRMVNSWNIDLMTSGPVLAIVLQGIHAIDNVRLMVGNTLPAFAAPGSIRGDYSIDSPALANVKKRAVKNIVHASGESEEAKYEIQLWFHENELHSYKRSDEEVMF